MSARSFSRLLLASSLLLSAAAASSAKTIQLVVPSFDYPDDGYNNTQALGIANNGTIVGTISENQHGTVVSFERFADGSFSQPFGYPRASVTIASGVNSSNLVCGFLFTDANHGFFYNGQAFTLYDVPEATGTFVGGVNDAGDFCGYSTSGPIGTGEVFLPFVNIGGTYQCFTIPGMTDATAKAINNLGQVTGTYVDPTDASSHGYLREADGTLIYPLDLPAASELFITGLNDKGLIVGSAPHSSRLNGFVFKMPGQFVSYNFADAVYGVDFSGINNSEVIPGYFISAADGLGHSFIAQIVK